MADFRRRLLAVSACMIIWCLITTFSSPPLGGNMGKDYAACAGGGMPFCICPRETICARDWKSIVFLVLARSSAYFDYPMYMLLFLSKANNLRTFLHASYLKEFLPLHDLHHLHSLAGAIVSFEVISHSFWHLLRWGLGDEIELLWENQTGVTGLLCLCLTPLIAWPMLFRSFKQRIAFEYRKAAHYLSIPWGISLMLHAPARHIFWVMGVPVAVYLLDYLVGYFGKVNYLPTLFMTRTDAHVLVSWENPPGFKSIGAGYVYICLPWVSLYQWHAFSIVVHPTLPNYSLVCMAAKGDWTKQVHQELSKPSCRPGYVYGPFPSPYSTAVNYDNIIAVATGIGITPALCLLTTLQAHRKVSMIWMCREPDLIEHVLSTHSFAPDAWVFIYYTGKRKLVLDPSCELENPTLRIVQGRPDMEGAIKAIVGSLQEQLPLPKELEERSKEMHTSLFQRSPEETLKARLAHLMATYSPEELFEMALDEEMTEDPEAEEAEEAEGRAQTPGVPPTPGFGRAALTPGFGRPQTPGRVPTPFASGRLCVRTPGLATPARPATPSNLVNKPQMVGRKAYRQFVESMVEVPPEVDIEDMMAEFDTEAAKHKGKLDKDGFEHFLNKVWGGEATPAMREEGSATMSSALTGSLAARKVLGNWELLYCGGSAPVVAELQRIKKTFGFHLAIEKFDW